MDKKVTGNLQEFDLIILGAGLIGLTAANLFAKQGFSLALIEAETPLLKWDESEIDIRCTAISRRSQKIFEEIGVWEQITKDRISSYRKMFVWDAAGFGEIQFDAADVAEPDLGHIIENRVMIKALWENLEKNPKISLFNLCRPKSFHRDEDKVTIELEEGILQAKCVVGADGANSWLRKRAKIKTLESDYHQTALVATVRTELPHQETAWQRFLPSGPLAFLPLFEPNTSSIVWSASPEKVKELCALEEKEFCEELAYALDYKLGKVISASPPKTFPLSMLQARQMVQKRLALLGDAAHKIHPLAGLGVNLGLADVAKLVEVITDAHQRQCDIGHFLVLRKYERARKSEIMASIAAMEFFKQTFGSQQSLVSTIRSVGLNCVNKSPFLKKQIILQAMGI